MEAAPIPADWRPVLAALANPGARRIFAQVVLAEDPDTVGSFLSASKRRHAVAALVRAGLVEEVEGRLVARGDVFDRALAAGAEPRPTGPERFLDGRGQIDRYPVDGAERRALLELVARRTLAPGEVLTELELNDRLGGFDRDTARLRREMVDAEILERTRSGSQYARVVDEPEDA